MFEDVVEARALRAAIIADPDNDAYNYPNDPRCPICKRTLFNHIDHLPCQRRGEWDRYGLHHGGR